MSYVDAFLDRKSDRIHVAERVNGKRILSDALTNYVFYYEHESGSHRSIFGHACKKVSTYSSQKFRAALKRQQDDGRRIFESDVNPVFRFLADNYLNKDAPSLHIGFFDIEADFHPEKGFAPTDDPFNAVTAITLYRSADQKLLTFALCPPTVAFEQAVAIGAKFDNTTIFDDEKAMLRAFLDEIEDVDCLTGWNCIPKTETVWLSDRIAQLGKVQKNATTAIHGSVLAYHDSGRKQVNKIILDNGQELLASDEHIIPVFQKLKSEYKYPSSLLASKKELRVDQIRELTSVGQHDLYLEVRLGNNTNVPYTYRNFLTENLEEWLAHDDFDFAVTHPELVAKVRHHYKSNGTLADVFRHSRYISSACEYPRMWVSKKHACLDVGDLRKQISECEEVNLVFRGNDPCCVRLDDPIPAAVLQLMGMQFTDGTYDRKYKRFTIYNTDRNLLEHFRSVVRDHSRVNPRAETQICEANDGCSSMDYRRGSVFGLLAAMIYDRDWNKRLDVSILSRLSCQQFAAFFSGMVDGDGCIEKNAITLCNFDGCCGTIQELLSWNGVWATRGENIIRVPAIPCNRQFVELLSVRQSERLVRIRNLDYFEVENAPNKLLKKFILDDRALVRIRAIEKTSEFAEMADIQTEGSFFHARGVLVHNSGAYDVPYLVNRISMLLGKATTRRFCLWDQLPSAREYQNKFGRMVKTFDFVGRVHLDYLDLYAKHTPQQRLSYALNAIGEIEVGDTKVQYEGTLDDLYKKDFPKFIDYNRQDVALMVKLDQKLKFIELANQIAHANCVLLKTTMGSVALIDQAITNEMHAMGFVVPDKNQDDEADDVEVEYDEEDESGSLYLNKKGEKAPVVGAYVADPKKGLQEWIGCVDINSLYPSAIRALNMSPETLIGQVRPIETMALIEKRIAEGTPRAEAWEGLFSTLEVQHVQDRDDAVLTVEFIDRMDDSVRTVQMTGREMHDFVFDPDNHLCISANGTIFRTDVEGMIPHLLGKWYADRKALQKKSKEFASMAKGIEIDEELARMLVDAE